MAVEHSIGSLYHERGMRNYFLAVQTLERERQLIGTSDTNLKSGGDRMILLFGVNEPRIQQSYNPVTAEAARVVGEIDASTLRAVDESVFEYIDVNRSRMMVDGNVGGRPTAVVLPVDFDKKYTLVESAVESR